MKFKKPNQHGVWSMIIIPIAFGIAVSGFTFYHLLLYLGLLASYFMSDQIFFYLKKRKKDSGYLMTASIFLLIVIFSFIPIILYKRETLMIFILMVPLSLMNAYFAKNKKERAFTNDLIAVSIFCLFGVLSTILNVSITSIQIWFPVFILSFLYYFGTILYVKTMIREKKSALYKWSSWIYHLCLVVIGLMISPLIMVMYLPSLIRAVLLYGKNIKIMHVGIIEIVNSVFILIIGIIYLH
ncbi:YwiC-like family protein [Mammaliicoccus sp. Dog046]|uniref:YwiC-like family protein n=1 Tax=Mammaliicoccus sp. Dog046 TaxID=3034233 RepID=UPI002B25E458|nr:YwiC-like family protein [Mammaliicoccus sp. Dog046]WQK85052.1 YwiC-like family protein [Mammaliicoccus sp. Dog046]